MLNASMGESLAARVTGAESFAGGELEAYFQPRWYAAYTRANHERRVADQLAERGVENFLPEYESVRKWKDRKVRLQMPLFPGYVLSICRCKTDCECCRFRASRVWWVLQGGQ